MSFGRKQSRPVDRALANLEEQIAATEREIRRRELQQATTGLRRSAGGTPWRAHNSRDRSAAAAGESLAEFLRRMLIPGSPAATPPPRPRRDLFDIPTDPIRELEADLTVPVRPTGAVTLPVTAGDGAATLSPRPVAASSRPGAGDVRLMAYLSVGGLRGPAKPLKHVQRRERKQFWKWIGLAFGVLWILWVVMR